MSTQAQYSKAAIKGHPIHPMLVSFPIALYTSGVVALFAFASTTDTFWYRASFTLLLAGAVMGAIAAIPGVIDLFFGVPAKAKATRTTGIIHAGLNVLSLCLFTGAGLSLLTAWRSPAGTEDWLPFRLPLTLGVIGLGLTGAAGFFGWKLVQTHHVGIAGPTEAEAGVAHATATP